MNSNWVEELLSDLKNNADIESIEDYGDSNTKMIVTDSLSVILVTDSESLDICVRKKEYKDTLYREPELRFIDLIEQECNKLQLRALKVSTFSDTMLSNILKSRLYKSIFGEYSGTLQKEFS